MKARTVSHQAQEWTFTMDGYATMKNKPFEVGAQTACEVQNDLTRLETASWRDIAQAGRRNRGRVSDPKQPYQAAVEIELESRRVRFHPRALLARDPIQ